MNSIQVIKPYLYEETWVFDDPTFGLVKEPFVAGIPQIIDAAVAEIENAQNGFRLLFSHQQFPGSVIQLNRLNPEAGGTWYQLEGSEMKGWLCPALFHYFPVAPERIFIAVEELKQKV